MDDAKTTITLRTEYDRETKETTFNLTFEGYDEDGHFQHVEFKKLELMLMESLADKIKIIMDDLRAEGRA